MRISDWSSDVCSSDLIAHPPCDPRCDPDPVGSKARAGRGPSYLPTAFGQLAQLTRPPTSLYVMLGSRRPIAVFVEPPLPEFNLRYAPHPGSLSPVPHIVQRVRQTVRPPCRESVCKYVYISEVDK